MELENWVPDEGGALGCGGIVFLVEPFEFIGKFRFELREGSIVRGVGQAVDKVKVFGREGASKGVGKGRYPVGEFMPLFTSLGKGFLK